MEQRTLIRSLKQRSLSNPGAIFGGTRQRRWSAGRVGRRRHYQCSTTFGQLRVVMGQWYAELGRDGSLGA